MFDEIEFRLKQLEEAETVTEYVQDPDASATHITVTTKRVRSMDA